MAQNITLMGANYEDVPAVELPKTGGGLATFTDVSGTTALAEDVAQGKSFFNAEGILTPGTATGVALLPYVIRPDAELVQRWDMDEYLVADQGIALPSYTTNTQTLKASVNLTPTITIDANHRFYVVERFLARPEYSASTIAKGRYEWYGSAHIYEVVEIPGNSFHAFNGKAATAITRIVVGRGVLRGVYWSSTTAISVATSNAYGTTMGVTTPTLSGTTLTVKTPTELIRGSTSYLTSAMWSLITDIRFQYVIEVYKAPNNNLSVDGWELEQDYMQIIACQDGKLT